MKLVDTTKEGEVDSWSIVVEMGSAANGNGSEI